MLRIEKKNAESPIEQKPRWIRNQVRTGKNHFCRLPTRPGVVKYSDLAGNVIWRGHIKGKKKESITAW